VHFDSNLYSKTNLSEAAWKLEVSDMATNETRLPMAGNDGFYQVELVLQSEM
jgi:hypothetical protein